MYLIIFIFACILYMVLLDYERCWPHAYILPIQCVQIYQIGRTIVSACCIVLDGARCQLNIAANIDCVLDLRGKGEWFIGQF